MNSRRVSDLMHADLTPAWLDRVAVDRALMGVPVGRALHHAERVEVARILLATGHTTPHWVSKLCRCSMEDARQLMEEVRSCST